MTKYITNTGIISLPRPCWGVIIYNMIRTGYSIKDISTSLKLPVKFVSDIDGEISSIISRHTTTGESPSDERLTMDHHIFIEHFLSSDPSSTKDTLYIELKKCFPDFVYSYDTFCGLLLMHGYNIA